MMPRSPRRRRAWLGLLALLAAPAALAAQAQAAETLLEGAAGGGAVKVVVTGGWQFQSVTIDPSAVDPDDVEMLHDLVLAALHHAAEQVSALHAGAADLKGMGLPDLFGGD